MGSKMFCFYFAVCISVFVNHVNASAIPMWEFLSKDEKMSFLYSLFANQVEELCEKSSQIDCARELLKYGLNTLKNMSEEDLDMMDPYQRGAGNMIWESLLRGHELQRTTAKPRVTTTAKPNSYDDQSFTEEFGSQSEASAKIEGNRVLPPEDFVYIMGSGPSQYVYPNQVQYFEKQKGSGVYHKYQQQHTEAAVNGKNSEERYEEIPLTGPMVVKVYPDGRPVQAPSIPQDEDLRQYQLSKIKLPTF